MLATLNKLKPMLYMPPEDTTENERLTFCLMVASDAIEDHCGRKFAKGTYTERRNGTASKYLALRNFPVHSILALDGDSRPITDYTLLDDGMLFHAHGWPRGDYNISVTYEGGYDLPSEEAGAPASNLPSTIEMACLMLAKMMYTGQWGKDTERIDGEYSVTYTKPDRPEDLPPVIQSLCSRHVWRLG
ncbi:phage gp6-like head-tail connector protein [Paenibacillus sp. OAE614]|uniref:phage gp6-like head-tail connector protein n=1 Tax=Paenibacillus sp. OAE614 TaxID=2663804 RepID=UPI00178C002E